MTASGFELFQTYMRKIFCEYDIYATVMGSYFWSRLNHDY